MSAEPFALTARAGNTFSRTINLTEADGAAVDLTDASVQWRLESYAGKYVYEDDDQASITGEVEGAITLALSAAVTRVLGVAASWDYEVVVEYPLGARETKLFGVLTFTPEIAAGVVPVVVP